MTLVISCITPNHLVQVSDRRLAWISGKNAGQIADDNSNKSVVICGRLVVAYTGLAQIGTLKTDEWICRVAHDAMVDRYNPKVISDAIASQATKDFQSIKLSKDLKRHAFLLSGWAKFNRQDSSMIPFISAISNALDDDWNWLSEATDDFKIQIKRLGKHRSQMASVGQPIELDIYKRLRRDVRNYAFREKGAEPYIEFLANAVRATAAQHQSVGKNLMAVSVPLHSLDSFGGIGVQFNIPMETDKPTALYLSEQAGNIYYLPNYVCNGMIFAGIQVEVE